MMKARASLRRLLPVLAGACLSVITGVRAAEVRWLDAPTNPRVEVSGAPRRRALQVVATEPCLLDWQKILTVRVEQANVIADVDTPPMLGRYEARDGTIVFTPEFPLQPGLRYRAEFRRRRCPAARRTRHPSSRHFRFPKCRRLRPRS